MIHRQAHPVVYVLHWYTGKDYSMVSPMLASYMTLLREDKVQETISVFPDASNTLGGSQYLSSPTIGDYRPISLRSWWSSSTPLTAPSPTATAEGLQAAPWVATGPCIWR